MTNRIGANRTAADYIAFPLDVPTFEAAKTYIVALADHVGMFKVGLELFIRCGPDIIKFIKKHSQSEIFLDLKLHDIPQTVLRATRRIAEFGVDFTTVHCAGSQKMLEAAVEGSAGRVSLLGVTVLTSETGDDIRRAGFESEFYADVSRLVAKRAALAKTAGLNGVICSGLEVGDIKKTLGREFLAITPGIRPGAQVSPKDDQKRVVTPADAVSNGADYLVIGRPIRDAKDPTQAAREIAKEIEAVL